MCAFLTPGVLHTLGKRFGEPQANTKLDSWSIGKWIPALTLMASLTMFRALLAQEPILRYLESLYAAGDHELRPLPF